MGNAASLQNSSLRVEPMRWQWVNAMAASRLDSVHMLKDLVSARWMSVVSREEDAMEMKGHLSKTPICLKSAGDTIATREEPSNAHRRLRITFLEV